jgi:hypothetical protein
MVGLRDPYHSPRRDCIPSDLDYIHHDIIYTIKVIFIVEGREIPANRSILAARSSHFRAMLYGGMRETVYG